MNLDCGKCKRSLARTAFICFEGQGDEYINSYFFCDACNAYTVEVYHDVFLGKPVARTGTLGREEGDRLVELIRKCPAPDDKRCSCPAHMQFG